MFCRKTFKQAHLCCHNTGWNHTILPTIIIIHSSKYRTVCFSDSFLQDVWGAIRTSSIFLYMYFLCNFFKAANLIMNYYFLEGKHISLHIHAHLNVRIISHFRFTESNTTRFRRSRGEISLFLISFSDLISDVFCIDITLLVL